MANGRNGIEYLHGQYVYYRRLRTDGFYPGLADIVFGANGEDGAFAQTLGRVSNLENIANYFINASNSELQKETALLAEKFGNNIVGNYDIQDKDFSKKLITALNTCLGMKEIFERNVALITETNGVKMGLIWFPDYFQKVWEANADMIYKKAVNIFTGSDGLPTEEALKQAIDLELPRLIREAVLAFFYAKQENGIDEKYADAYHNIAKAVQDVNNKAGNEYIKSFMETYKLNELSTILSQNTKTQQQLQQAMAKGNDSFNIHSNIHSRGGVTMEHFRTLTINFIGQELEKNQNLDVKAIQTGSTGMKPDVIATVGVNISAVENWLKENDFGTRDKDTKAILKLQEELKKFDDGFITYINAKNYKIDSNFESRGGFSAGEAITLQNFQNIANNLNMNYDALIRTCMQLIPGAIGDKNMDKVKLALTKAIATALFDDFNMVGVVEDFGAKSIHLMDLDGVYIPASFFFWLLSDAFHKAAEDINKTDKIEQLVKVTITTPASILYPQKKRRGNPGEWQEQANDALTRIKIGYHFLASFKSIIQEYVKV